MVLILSSTTLYTGVKEMTKEEFRTKCEALCEKIKEVIEADVELTWKQKAEILEESSSDCDCHIAIEEFVSWIDEFMPKD